MSGRQRKGDWNGNIKTKTKGEKRELSLHDPFGHPGSHDDVYSVCHERILFPHTMERDCKGAGLYRTGEFPDDFFRNLGFPSGSVVYHPLHTSVRDFLECHCSGTCRCADEEIPDGKRIPRTVLHSLHHEHDRGGLYLEVYFYLRI